MATGCIPISFLALAVSLAAQPPAATPKPVPARPSASKPPAAKAAKPKPPESPAHQLVRQGLQAMGGEDALRRLKTVRYEYAAHRSLLEQSERPEGPWVTSYETGDLLAEPAGGRLRWTLAERGFATPTPRAATFVISGEVAAVVGGEKYAPSSINLLADATDRLRYGPENILLQALEAPDLQVTGEESFQGLPHHLLSFTRDRVPVTIRLNARTFLPDAVDYTATREAEFFWSVWGDIRFRHRFGLWVMEPGGLVLPRQRDEERNGTLYRSLVVIKADLNPEVKETDFTIPMEVRRGFTASILQNVENLGFGVPGVPVRELGSGVYFIPGRWALTIIRQEDGMVILEAPISSGYSRKAIEEASWRGRNAPIKAVISTADGWPLIGGLREYVAAGVPIYAHEINKPLLERLLATPRTLLPDTLAKTPRAAQWKWISAKTVIGKGANVVEVYPISTGAASERALMVYLPSTKLLYVGEMFNRLGDGTLFMPVYAAEVIAAVEREKLKVDAIYGAHTQPVAWAVFLKLYENARAPQTPAPKSADSK